MVLSVVESAKAAVAVRFEEVTPTEIILEFAPVNSVQVGHFARAELLVEHLEVAWKCSSQSLIVGTETVPLCGGFVCPRLKLFEGRNGNDAWKPLEHILKLGLNSHRRLVVSSHTMTLDRLEKGGTDAMRVTVVVLQGLVVVRARVEVICNDGRTVV